LGGGLDEDKGCGLASGAAEEVEDSALLLEPDGSALIICNHIKK